MYIKRKIQDIVENSKKSILLLGPRQTGKSSLLKQINIDYSINLSKESDFLHFSGQPDLLENLIEQGKYKKIVIDEIQRLPNLLNTVQYLIDDKKIQFYLIGSSARKLKKGQANLLPGRLLGLKMNPFLIEETGIKFNLPQALSTGMLPEVLLEKNKTDRELLLSNYAGTYLKEEILSEALTRNIEGYSRFLFIAASKNCEYIDYSKLGSLAHIQQKTASRFFEILEDTLIVRRLPAFAKVEFRRLIQHPKFHFFDVGVLNALLGNFQVSSDRIGMLFETFVINQIIGMAESRSSLVRYSQYRTEAGAEVDLVLENKSDVLAIEIKATKKIDKTDLTGLKSFQSVCPKAKKILIYLGSRPQKIDSVEILPLNDAIKYLQSWY